MCSILQSHVIPCCCSRLDRIPIKLQLTGKSRLVYQLTRHEEWTESVNDDRNAELSTYAVMKRGLQIRISCASIIYSESRLWLVLIKRRLSFRQKIRNPFNGECQRDIPFAIFEALKAAVHSSGLDEFNEPNCYISSNRKASAIHLPHQQALLMCLLSLVATPAWK